MTTGIIAGVDVGGTAIKIALFDQAGSMLLKTQEPTPVAGGVDAIIESVHKTIQHLISQLNTPDVQLLGIGVGVPGFVDNKSGIVFEAVNLHWKTHVPLREKLEHLTKVPVYVGNDANNAALGEMWQGAGQGATDLVAITLGTGVGGGVIVEGRVIQGVTGAGGEIGHITVEPTGGPPCNCGKTGCLENYASATGIIREGMRVAKDQSSPFLAERLSTNGKVNAKDVFDAALAGDEAALAIVDQAAHYLGFGLSQLANILNPAKIVIGGGVSAAGDFLFDRIRQSFQKFTLPIAFRACEILPATTGNDAGVIGAAWLVHSQQ
ncbi:ROK family glucokinase [Brevibacillus sp. SYSU BS000544]|uniref:ROK family glucokinase n=1 Tax=Brevibacillus sp. SYSU BS000544 TaxID=3416443 RepID=UPI003CE4F9C7